MNISIAHAHGGRTDSKGCHNSSTGYHCHSSTPTPTPTPKLDPISQPSYSCQPTKQCSQMTTCEEAKFHFSKCGKTRLDKDGDNIPCESICGVSGTPEFEISPIKSENGYLVTNDLWIKSEIITEEKGVIQGLLETGGGAVTNRGDTVIWGYFYAGQDVIWGDLNNPEVFIKIWFDINGRVDVNYFHVSVPDIDIFSMRNNSDLLTSRATLETRYIRHFFEKNEDSGADVIITGDDTIREPNSLKTQNINVIVNAVVNTDDGEDITAKYRMGGNAIVAGGGKVFWGYFYVDPKSVSWGNYNNPEVFVKTWFDTSGRIDVNFFHVSVSNIEIWSSISSSHVATRKNYSTLTLENRYVRHEYVK